MTRAANGGATLDHHPRAEGALALALYVVFCAVTFARG